VLEIAVICPVEIDSGPKKVGFGLITFTTISTNRWLDKISPGCGDNT
jgi:hypothetical protein